MNLSQRQIVKNIPNGFFIILRFRIRNKVIFLQNLAEAITVILSFSFALALGHRYVSVRSSLALAFMTKKFNIFMLQLIIFNVLKLCLLAFNFS